MARKRIIRTKAQVIESILRELEKKQLEFAQKLQKGRLKSKKGENR